MAERQILKSPAQKSADDILREGLLPNLLGEYREWYRFAVRRQAELEGQAGMEAQLEVAKNMARDLRVTLDMHVAEAKVPEELAAHLRGYITQPADIPALPERFEIQPMPEEADAQEEERNKRKELQMIDMEIEDRLALAFRHDEQRTEAITDLEQNPDVLEPEFLAASQTLADDPLLMEKRDLIREKVDRLVAIDRRLEESDLAPEEIEALQTERERVQTEHHQLKSDTPELAAFFQADGELRRPDGNESEADPTTVLSTRLMALQKIQGTEPNKRAARQGKFNAWLAKQTDREAIEAHIQARVDAIVVERRLIDDLGQTPEGATAVTDACQDLGIMRHLALSPTDPPAREWQALLNAGKTLPGLQLEVEAQLQRLRDAADSLRQDSRALTLASDLDRMIDRNQSGHQSTEVPALRRLTRELDKWLELVGAYNELKPIEQRLAEYAADKRNAELPVSQQIREILSDNTRIPSFRAATDRLDALRQLETKVNKVEKARGTIRDLAAELRTLLESGAIDALPQLKESVERMLQGPEGQPIEETLNPIRTADALTSVLATVKANRDNLIENTRLYEELEAFLEEHADESGTKLDELRAIRDRYPSQETYDTETNVQRFQALQSAAETIQQRQELLPLTQKKLSILKSLDQYPNIPEHLATEMKAAAEYYEPFVASQDWDQLYELDRVLDAHAQQALAADAVPQRQQECLEACFQVLEDYKRFSEPEYNYIHMLDKPSDTIDAKIDEFRQRFANPPEGESPTQHRMNVLQDLWEYTAGCQAQLLNLSYARAQYGATLPELHVIPEDMKSFTQGKGYQTVFDPNRPPQKATGWLGWLFNLITAISRWSQVRNGSAIRLESQLPLGQAEREACVADGAARRTTEDNARGPEDGESMAATGPHSGHDIEALLDAADAAEAAASNPTRGVTTAAAGGDCATVRHTAGSVLGSGKVRSGARLSMILEEEDEADTIAGGVAPPAAEGRVQTRRGSTGNLDEIAGGDGLVDDPDAVTTRQSYPGG